MQTHEEFNAEVVKRFKATLTDPKKNSHLFNTIDGFIEEAWQDAAEESDCSSDQLDNFSAEENVCQVIWDRLMTAVKEM